MKRLIHDLQVDSALASFVEQQALPGTGLAAADFWRGCSNVFTRFAPENQQLLRSRDRLQSELDAYHRVWQVDTNSGGAPDDNAYIAKLREIGYLVSDPPAFNIAPANVDDELAKLAGPQLVVPVLNDRFVLNAANARWGSLYDALYGTDALGSPPPATNQYDKARGAQVIAWARRFLDATVPLAAGSYLEVRAFAIADGELRPALRDPSALVGYRGTPAAPTSILLRHHGLHIELLIDRAHAIGRTNAAGLADVILESALSTIVDLEDSIAAVDAEDKVNAYRNWLGLMKGDLVADFDKGGQRLTRRLNPDRRYLAARGDSELTLPGRSLLFVRNVGHLMTTPAVLLADGREAPEGILDGIVTALIAMHDLKRRGQFVNSRAGSIYIVKPKMHGPGEADFCNRLFDAIEDLLGLERYTIKVGLMEEERRTSANLAACIHALRGRIVFVNTGFLDRTGDEIHTSMQAGAVIPKADIKSSTWIKAYEDRNVQIALACGFSGRAQIGKGMWAAPDRMADMLDQKLGHPKSGANTAWVPSPTAATLHATHYHLIDVYAVQRARRAESLAPIGALLTPPLANATTRRSWSAEQIRRELDNNVQGILGYVVRWIDQGIGCSKVPDINDIGLMEDRATLRISSQHIANWLLHGVATPADVDAALLRMAAKVDAQNAGDAAYRPMSGGESTSLAFQAARALIFEGVRQPNGYTEPLLHRFRLQLKEQAVRQQ
jgi:malate synthase